MSPSSSIGDLLTPSGRLRRQWTAAVEDPDPHSGLARLREVCVRMERRPDTAAPLWTGFLRSMVGQPFRPLLTEADFEALERIGGLVAEAGSIPLDQAVRPLAVARTGRGERGQADELLTRLYWADSVQDQTRAALADELARSGRRDDARLRIYADLLGRAGPRPPAVVELAADVLRVDFSSDPAQLHRANELAATGLPGADRAAGFYLLSVTAELDAARTRFHAACAADPRDGTALLGLLAAHVRAGQAASIPGWALDAARGAAPDVAAMGELGRVLAWFDSGSDTPPPAAGRLAARDLTREAGPWSAYALGRLHLLDGDAARARDLLVPLTRSDTSVPQWRYHAAWSQLLCGDRAGLRPLIGTMTRRPEDWALACLLLDADPDAVPGTEAEHAAATAPPGYERIARVRRDLAAGRRPAGAEDRPVPGPPGEGGGLPERLEALRTALGEAYGGAGPSEMAALLRNPLYRRLPQADRLLWSGLLALRGEPEEGRRLLGAALALGHERAALVLAAHHLEERRPGRAHRLLTGRSGAKAELLRVWAEAAGGGSDEMIADRLERLAARGLPQVPYVLGAVRLHQLAGEGATLEPEDAPYHARRAARDLRRAVAAGPGAVPSDAALLLRAARTVTHGTAPGQDDGPAGQSPSVRQHPWAEWVLGLALLAEDPEAADVALCGRLAALVEEAGEPPPQSVTGLATALTRAGMLSEDPYRRDTLARLVRGLADRHASPEVQALAGRVTAAAMALPAVGRPPLGAARPTGAVRSVSALASAAHDLSRGDRAAAVRQLRAAPADSAVCALLADVLDGRPPVGSPPGGTGERAALIRVVHAAGLAESDPRRCLELLSAAAADCDLAAVTDLARVLPALFARAEGTRAGRGAADRGRPGGAGRRPGGAHPLAAAVKRLTDEYPPTLDAAILAGCATAVGDDVTAEAMWVEALDRATREGRDSGHVRARYARLLCHRAVTFHRAGEPLQSAKLLRRAAGVLPSAGPPPKRVPSRGGAESLARGLELDGYVGRLLDQVFPGAERQPVPWERPGRYAALEAAVEADAGLSRALRSGGRKGVERSWADCLKTLGYDVRLHHTLALLYRGMALNGPAPTASAGRHLARATVLWTLLLASGGFWEQHGEVPAGPEAETRLRGAVCRELFGTHRRLGAEALRAGERETARLHLTVLEAAREGDSAVRGLLRDFGIPWSPAVDARRWTEISALAGAATDAWCAEVVETAEKAVRDPAAIARLAEGIDKDYESGIREVEPLIGLGVPLPRLLQTGLDWYNGLQTCLYQMRRTDELRKVVGRARKFADALVPLCTPGKGHLPGNRALGAHFVDRGLFVARDSRAAVALYEAALKWDPGNVSATQLLAQTAYSARLDRIVAALDAKDYPRALTAAKEAYGAAGNDKDRSVALTYQALSHNSSEELPEALSLLKRALGLDPANETARSLYGLLRDEL
ncbi:tetratricopeptide repeat protein [Streptomyces lushanensis]|uniref:tetratricopeptide repeat protein n=1 Tax=Streptomyces lushanensis TaxID=1434255 RepID=UPI00082D01C1|nr:tetratricopeptide repeat protein [Streptomyces lushanensis]